MFSNVLFRKLSSFVVRPFVICTFSAFALISCAEKASNPESSVEAQNRQPREMLVFPMVHSESSNQEICWYQGSNSSSNPNTLFTTAVRINKKPVTMDKVLSEARWARDKMGLSTAAAGVLTGLLCLDAYAFPPSAVLAGGSCLLGAAGTVALTAETMKAQGAVNDLMRAIRAPTKKLSDNDKFVLMAAVEEADRAATSNLSCTQVLRTHPGPRFGPPIRCDKNGLLGCLKPVNGKSGGGACVTKYCNPTDPNNTYKCEDSAQLTACAKGHGGAACTGPEHGRCRG
jgi:hypothetical protein